MRSRSGTTIRTVLVASSTLHRDALRLALEPALDVELVGTFEAADELLRSAARLDPDVAVLELDLAPINGVQLALRLQKIVPNLGIVLLVSHWHRNLLSSLPSDDVQRWSYLFDASSQTVTALIRAIKVTHARLLDLGPAAPARTRQEPTAPSMLPPNTLPPNTLPLTPRQRQVLELLARGLSNRAIAEMLHLKEKTIENQLGAIYGRLQLDPRRHLHRRVLAARHAHGPPAASGDDTVDP